jgi:putative spermidine/putrescine transport system substrate-binding protein
VVYLDDKTQPLAVEAKAVMKLDPKIVTNLGKLYDEAKQKDGYGPAMLFWAWGLVYNEEAFRKAGIPEPTSWEDLWNPKLSGKVGISDIGGPGGIDFVLKAAELSGGGVDNLQPGLDKIAKLKVASFFNSSNALAVSMTSGDIWVAPLNNGRSWGMIDSGFKGRFIIPKEGGYSHITSIDVVASTRSPKEAQEFVNFVLDPVAQLGQAFEIPYGPVNKTLETTMLAYPEVSKKFPMPGNAMMKRLSDPNWNVIFDNFPAVINAWNRTVKAANR